MPATAPITHAQLGEVLAGLHFGVDASDLHGSLTGFLCAGGQANASDWLAALQLQLDEGERVAATRSVALQQLFADCAAWLEDPDLRFEPLLPAADTPVATRADALVEWCRGFLGGIGLAGTDRSALSADCAEILHDFGTIAGTHFEYADRDEDESALSEVIEFIRVGVLLLHAELVKTGAPKKVTLH